jgi:hypothetical protein
MEETYKDGLVGGLESGEVLGSLSVLSFSSFSFAFSFSFSFSAGFGEVS